MSTTHLVPLCCLIVFVLAFVISGIAPRYRKDWMLENLPTLMVVVPVVVGYRGFRFSDVAYVQGTLFVLLHLVGSHYTYAQVPIGDWAADTFGWSRNHYDRFVHFIFGVLMFRPIRELAIRRPLGRFADLFLSISVVAFFALVYEVAEWIIAVIVAPEAGAAFLGMQGDPWDCQKDMFVACIGATLVAVGSWWRHRGRD